MWKRGRSPVLALGNRVATADANGHQNQAAYDQRSRVIQLIDALGQITEIYYNEENGDRGDNKPTAVTDAAGHTTWFNYDSLGRVIREIDQLGKQTNLQYDAVGNLASRTDALGRTMTYSYDALGRLLQKSGSDGSVATFQYDTRGRLSYASNQHIAYGLTYDTLGRLTGISDSNNRSISYQYDAVGNRTRMTMPDGETVNYAYDAANRLSRIASFLGEFSFSYDALGNRTKLVYPNGVATSYGYDQAGRLTAILAQGRGGSVNSFSYTHDGVGNRLSKTEQQKERTTKYDYAYDATYQLTQSLPIELREEKEREHEKNHRAENFVYGAVGNRLRGPGRGDASVYNELNQLLASRAEEFRYDANGNLIYRAGLADDDEDDYEQQGWSYEYDLENRLVKASKVGDHGSRSISFKYDSFGRRIEKKVEETEHGEVEARTTTYVYDNEDIILEISGKAISRYVHGPGIDEPLAVEQKRSTYFFHADGLGSIVNLTDQRGRVVQSYEYSSFGRMKEHGGEVKQPYGYTGREWDRETGLYYYRARYYDPKGGRFISKDPIGFAGGDVNLYRYVQNNPVNWIDPWGLCPSGTHAATPAELENILKAANEIKSKGLAYDQMQCNQFVDRSINEAYPGAVSGEPNTTAMRNGKGPFEVVPSPSVGNLSLMSKPGHVVFNTSVTNGNVTQFLGSQSSTGPATVNLPNSFWSKVFQQPENVTYLRICLPN